MVRALAASLRLFSSLSGVACSLQTCVIWLLFRYRFTRVIWGILGVSGVNIFMFMGGQFWLKVLQVAHIPVDGVTFAILLWNFSVVGVLATFFLPLPLRLKQGARSVACADVGT